MNWIGSEVAILYDYGSPGGRMVSMGMVLSALSSSASNMSSIYNAARWRALEDQAIAIKMYTFVISDQASLPATILRVHRR